MYVKPEVRKGLLGRMLTELLETRVMVKQAMKSVKEDKASTVILMDSVDAHTLNRRSSEESLMLDSWDSNTLRTSHMDTLVPPFLVVCLPSKSRTA